MTAQQGHFARGADGGAAERLARLFVAKFPDSARWDWLDVANAAVAAIPASTPLLCSICPWIGEDGRTPTPAVTVINGHAVCWEHHRAAHLARDHRHAVEIAGGTL